MNDAEDIFINQDSIESADSVNEEHLEDLIEQKFWEKSKMCNPFDFDYGDDYFEAVKAIVNREYWLRINSWWKFNDEYRYNSKKEFKLPKFHENNLNELLEIYDLNWCEDLILKAEIFRALGQFSDCLELIKEIENDNETEEANLACETIRYYALLKNRKVQLIEYPTE